MVDNNRNARKDQTFSFRFVLKRLTRKGSMPSGILQSLWSIVRSFERSRPASSYISSHVTGTPSKQAAQ